MEQDHFWSKVSGDYEKEFIDPFRKDAVNPLHKTLKVLAKRGCKTVADLGCGIGPLLPFLAETFPRVLAVDFAEGMLERSRQAAKAFRNIEYLHQSLTDLTPLHGILDIAIAINSLVMPNVRDQDRCLQEIHASLKPGGYFVSILPAMDAVHYLTMLLVDRALATGKPIDAARKNAARLNELEKYDFAFGQFYFNGIEQHFWQPFEISYRFARAGLKVIHRKKVRLAWKQFAGSKDFKDLPAPWDWFIVAKRK